MLLNIYSGLDSPSAVFLRTTVMDFLLNLRCDAEGKIGITDHFLKRRSSSSSSSTALYSTSTPDAITAASDRIEWTSFVAGAVVAAKKGATSAGSRGESPAQIGGGGGGSPSTTSRESSPNVPSIVARTASALSTSTLTDSKGFCLNLANAFQAVIAVLKHVRGLGVYFARLFQSYY